MNGVGPGHLGGQLHVPVLLRGGAIREVPTWTHSRKWQVLWFVSQTSSLLERQR